MGYLGYFYAEFKPFEICSDIGIGGVCLAESRGIFRAVVLGRLSVVWLTKSLVELIKGKDLRDFCGAF